jgi:hypothetical protein
MTSTNSTPIPPIACDMTRATDTGEERLDTYRRLYADALVGRERTETGIRFRFAADPGIEQRVRDLAALEKDCCAFFDFTISPVGDEVHWDASVVDDDLARRILDEMYELPDTLGLGNAQVFERFTSQGLEVVIDDGVTYRRATTAELGL